MLLQYPNTDGQINDYSQVIEKAHSQEKKVRVACLHGYMLYQIKATGCENGRGGREWVGCASYVKPGLS